MILYKTTPLFYCETCHLLLRVLCWSIDLLKTQSIFYCHIPADRKLTGTYEKTGTKLNNLHTYTSSENNLELLNCYIMVL